MRQLLLIIVFVLAARWLVKLQRAGQARGNARADGGRGASSSARSARRRNTPSLAEPVERCAACGVHAPRSESVLVGQQYFCCAEHARPYTARAAGTR
ncbi:MAG: PP0621 family protein [Trinickia sp.]|uniref:PP0621 family protein n=1 Tax=Trinickia sp. TaxID=2571163 RepID=UPI003F7F7A85